MIITRVSVSGGRNVLILCVAKNFGKRFFPRFPLPPPHFVVFIHGERDLSSLPCLGGAAVQISLGIEECCVAGAISSRMMREPLPKEICGGA